MTPRTSAAAPWAALATVLHGQGDAPDDEALATIRAGHPGLRLYALCLDGVEPPEGASFDRMIQLPLRSEHAAYALSILMQLCFNEGAAQVGAVAALGRADLEEASRHLNELSAGRADAIIVSGATAAVDRLFLSERASFLASSWSALGGDLLVDRTAIASGLLGLAERKGLIYGGAYHAMGRTDMSAFASRAELIRSKLGLTIGKLSPPRAKPVRRVAVVTPYYKEPDREIVRAIDSVRSQTRACDHIMVSDGFPNDVARAPGLVHIELGASHGDGGNTGRYVGSLVALALGYDAVILLDADNWFEPKHVQRMLERQHETSATAVFSRRNVYLPDGHKVMAPDVDEDTRGTHVDTSCYMLTRACEYASHLWGQMPPEWGAVGDRVVFAELTGQHMAQTGNRTMNYQSNYAYHFRIANRPVPEKVNAVPLELVRSFMSMPLGFRTRSISRTGRVIRIRGG